jgi:hypothetical protein
MVASREMNAKESMDGRKIDAKGERWVGNQRDWCLRRQMGG